MTTLEITLPDALAREAQQAGLLNSETIETLLRQSLRAQHVAELRNAVEQIANLEGAPMTMEEIESEIQKYRQERRRAAGT